VLGFYLAGAKGKRGESYNLCAAGTHSISDVLHTAIRLSGVKVEVRQAPRLMRPSDERIIFGSTKKMYRDTRWKPRFTLAQTLQSMFEYWEKAS